jgi:hypothetical protein
MPEGMRWLVDRRVVVVGKFFVVGDEADGDCDDRCKPHQELHWRPR